MINNGNVQPTLSAHDKLKRQYSSARNNLVLMLFLTAVNIVLLFAESDYMMLFSATVPYYSLIFAMVDQTGILFVPGIFITIVSIITYFLCWIFSKKHYGWMIAALVLFIIDTICLIGVYILIGDFSGIIDFLIHILVLYYLIVGVVSGAKLKKCPEPVDMPQECPVEFVSTFETNNSVYKRMADLDVKARVLLETTVLRHKVCYRRVKRTNELVIDGYVYDEVEMLVERAHALTAVIDGHTIVAGFDGAIKSYILLDDQEVAKKTRLY